MRLELTLGTDRMAQMTSIHSHNLILASGIHLHKDQHINLLQDFNKVLVKIASTGITVWLEDHDQTTLWPALTYRLNGSHNLGWVMTIIIYDTDNTIWCLVAAIALETTSYTRKML